MTTNTQKTDFLDVGFEHFDERDCQNCSLREECQYREFIIALCGRFTNGDSSAVNEFPEWLKIAYNGAWQCSHRKGPRRLPVDYPH